MDQAELADQTLFWHHGKRGQDPSLNYRLRLRAGGHLRKELGLEVSLSQIL